MKLRMAMIGGGIGSFIGPVHIMVARMDNMIELVAGAFSCNPDNSARSGLEYGLTEERIYSSWREMIEKERMLPESLRLDFVCIATPNHLHYKPTLESIKVGFHVVFDKPLCLSVK